MYGHLSCVQLLLEKGASLEAKDEEGAIPLHDACAGGFTQIVQLLISSTSDPTCVKTMLETVDIEGDTVSPFIHKIKIIGIVNIKPHFMCFYFLLEPNICSFHPCIPL
nr:ankyrin repeat and SOCS box protein 13 [Ipomoea batatas]